MVSFISNRNSSIELLRILAMFFVLVQHANFIGIGVPSGYQCINSPVTTFFSFLIQSLSIVAVNVFVLISGWFGIKPSLKKIFAIIFQVLFFSLLMLVIYCIINGWTALSIKSLLKTVMVTKCYWFIKSYICLIILSPILNLFAEKASRRTLGWVLICFFVFQTVYGWTDSAPEFIQGSSVVSFSGLYLLARYLKLYPVNFLAIRKNCLISYILLSFVLALIAWLLVRLDIQIKYSVPLVYSFINPLVICSSVCLLFSFINTNLGISKAINWISVSVLAVYIIHVNEFVFGPFLKAVWYIYTNYSLVVRLLLLFSFLALGFLACVLLDKCRLWCWHKIENRLTNDIWL